MRMMDPAVVEELEDAYRAAGRGLDVQHSPEIEVPFGSGIGNQGFAYEKAMEARVPAENILPPGFKTFDQMDRGVGLPTSLKTLDTTTPARVAKPSQLRSSLRRNVNDAEKFDRYELSGVELTSDQFSARAVRFAVPLETTAEQWTQINLMIQYAREHGVQLVPHVVTNSNQ
jgi:hypothetical protein